MVLGIKRHWRELKSGHSGRRFQDRYERSRETRGDRPLIRQSVQPVIGVILLAVGIVFCIIPGPGLPLVFLGAAVLSERSRTLARVLDWMELKLRGLLSRLKARWHKASPVVKNALIVGAAAAAGGVGYGAYHVVFRP